MADPRDLLHDINMVADRLERKAAAVRQEYERVRACFADEDIAANPNKNAILASVVDTACHKVVEEVVHCSNAHTQGVVRSGLTLTRDLMKEARS